MKYTLKHKDISVLDIELDESMLINVGVNAFFERNGVLFNEP